MIKKQHIQVIALCICLSVVGCFQLQAQMIERSPDPGQQLLKKQNIKIRPLPMLVAVINVGYERAISTQGSVAVSLFFRDEGATDDGLSLFGIFPEYRHYTNQAMYGFYLAPSIGYLNSTLDDGFDKATLSSLTPGFKLGWNWIVGKRKSFVLDLGLGARYYISELEVELGDPDDTAIAQAEGFAPVITFAIGYAF